MARVLLAVAGIGLLLTSPIPSAPAAGGIAPDGGPAVTHYDLASFLAAVAREHPMAADTVQEYYRSGNASLHLHILGREQTTPLHIHRATEEATVIVSGSPRVIFEFGRNGRIGRIERSLSPGMVVISTPYAGHEWHNPKVGEMQANLVFASPPFEGNLYIKPGNAKLTGGKEPFVYDSDRGLKELLSYGRPWLLERLPLGGEKVASLLVKETGTIPGHPRSPTFLYVVRGRGRLMLDAGYRLDPMTLLGIPPGVSLTVTADPGFPLVLVAFRPEP
jgi:hypothetical protein